MASSLSRPGRTRRVVLLYDRRTGEALDFFIEDEMEAIVVFDAVPAKPSDRTGVEKAEPGGGH